MVWMQRDRHGAGEVGRLGESIRRGSTTSPGQKLIPVCLMCGYLYTLNMNIQGGKGRRKGTSQFSLTQTEKRRVREGMVKCNNQALKTCGRV